MITFRAGDSKELTINVVDDKGAAFDLTNITDFIFVISKTKLPKKTPEIVKKLTSGVTVAGSSAKITLTSAETKLLEGEYYCEAKVIDGFGNVTTVLEETVEVLHSVIVAKNLI